MVILCGSSAWQYWRTPPVLRDEWMDETRLGMLVPGQRDAQMLPPQLRANAREADRLVHGRLLAELKGVSLPAHVMVDGSCDRHPDGLTIPHVIPQGLPVEEGTVNLGGGLRVLSPELAVATQCRKRGIVAVAKMMFEACGIFSILPRTGRLRVAVDDLVERGVVSRGGRAFGGVFGYSDESGEPLGVLDTSGDPLPWSPSFDRYGNLTDLWKRPPLTSVERIADAIAGLGGVTGLDEARRALGVTRNGAASPAEAQACLLLCAGARLGAEAWGNPDLNRRVAYTPEARALAGTSYAIADLLWPDRKVDLEVQGKAFHADDLGFTRESGRRAALESMGYTVLEITHAQMANLALLDAMLPSLAERVGFALRRRSATFLARRGALHRELFGAPYDPD